MAAKAGALRGWQVAVTRPVGQAAALARRVRAHGGAPLVLPSASLRITSDPGRAIAALRAPADALVFISPAAVRFAFALAPGLEFPRRAAILAVGPTSRDALRRRGIAAECPAERHDSEALLAMPALAGLGAGARATVVGAPGGRDFVAGALAARGVAVRHAEVYARVAPRWTRAHHAALAAADPRRLVWLVSSVESVAAVCALTGPGFARLAAAHAVASSARVAAALRAAGVRRIRVASSALPVALVEGAVAIAL